MSTEKEEEQNLRCIRTPRHNYSDAKPNRNELQSLSDLDSFFFLFFSCYKLFNIGNFKWDFMLKIAGWPRWVRSQTEKSLFIDSANSDSGILWDMMLAVGKVWPLTPHCKKIQIIGLIIKEKRTSSKFSQHKCEALDLITNMRVILWENEQGSTYLSGALD